MRLFEDTQETISDLFEETGEYACLYKQYAQKKLTEKATALLSGVITAMVLILLGSVVLLLLFFSLAYLLGNALGSIPLGFGCLALVAFLLLLVVYLCRKLWIAASVSRLVRNAIGGNCGDIPVCELEKKLHTGRDNIVSHLHGLADDTSKYNSKAMRVSHFVYHVLSLYNGFRIGISAVNVVNGIFGKKRRKKK